MMIKQTLDLSATSDAPTTYETDYLTGKVRKVRMIIGTMSTSKTVTLGISGESTTVAWAKYKMGTTSQNYFPTHAGQGATGKATSQNNFPIALCNDKIKVWVMATSSGDQRTGTLKFWIDGDFGTTT